MKSVKIVVVFVYHLTGSSELSPDQFSSLFREGLTEDTKTSPTCSLTCVATKQRIALPIRSENVWSFRDAKTNGTGNSFGAMQCHANKFVLLWHKQKHTNGCLQIEPTAD